MRRDDDEGDEEGPVEVVQDAAAAGLGVNGWDRPSIFRESADATTDNGVAFWAVLLLSGAIATLGLAMNSSAVVIGAMLVAPLLAPVVGLALALAVGDGRLTIQAAAVVLGSTVGVVATAAALTAVLPFQTVTVEIAARARPTTLDLAIAIFSGLVGAVVTVTRGSRLSAAIPGVAISVALIPPLAVAGFGIAADWNGALIRGSLLLYGANLAGIVLSGMLVFLLVGMHRPEIAKVVHEWHGEATPHGLAAIADRIGVVRRLEILESTWARVGLVLAFAVALGFPLRESLAQIAREARVERAVGSAAEAFQSAGRSSILSREVVYAPGRARVYLRVATTRWFDEEPRLEFERQASAAAGEPVTLSLEQLPASLGDVDDLADMLPTRTPAATAPDPGPGPAGLADLAFAATGRLDAVAGRLALPEGVAVAGMEFVATRSGQATVRVAYASPARLPPEAEQMLARQLRDAVEVPDLRVRLSHVSTAPRPIGAPADSARLREVADLLAENEALAVEVVAPPDADSTLVAATAARLVRLGVDSLRISTVREPQPGLRLRVRAVAAPEPPG